MALAEKKAISISNKAPSRGAASQGFQRQARNRDERDQNGVDHHRAGHRDAVGRRQVAGGLEAEHQRHDREIQRPVGERHVDLPGFHVRGVDDLHARQVAELNRLARHRERPRDHRLRGDHRRRRGQHHHRDQRPAGRQQVERILDRVGILSSSAPWP
jgi:hypothetical protein